MSPTEYLSSGYTWSRMDCGVRRFIPTVSGHFVVNRLKPDDPYMGRTASLTSKRCILYIYSTNIGTEYFKHAL